MIVVEGKTDKELLIALGMPKKLVKVAGAKGRVCNYLRKSGSRFRFGMVDEDPEGQAQPPLMERMQVVEERHGVRVLEDPGSGNRLLVLCPRLEEWVLQAAKGVGVSVNEFGLPPDAREFKKLPTTRRLDDLRRLVRHLHERKSPPIRHLEHHLRLMKKALSK
ncbi:MAG: hypothetical protein D6765_04190 [Bacteroidetes bacterium]|nr:MAG: hypothetical protein D6765_04190 [Bacteroidota bacterium]